MKRYARESLHPTAQAMVDAVREMLKSQPYNTIKSQAVLHRIGISRGPLYHHFLDFNDLIETAQLQLYCEFNVELVESIERVILDCDSIEEAREAFTILAARGVVPNSNLDRTQRIGVIYSAALNPSFAAKLRGPQESLTQEWMALHLKCVEKG